MYKNITNEQTKEILLKVQDIQRKDAGVHSFSISVYNKDGKMWFTANYFVNKKIVSFECYEFLSYAENLEKFNNFAERIIAECNKTDKQ